ncbi:universal stress protein [Erythrobacter insulae]|uniref:Universal stress protein n=1 Tax=Erythrobacter insulae TaxID=2584124 RepID=A0A547PBX5_9SPHN|nr:universal stress protein [Erythrobacter insulae]TRD11640.1 universal stress protein [Erythrobacter insulae]
MKSILLHVADDPCLEARVQTALDLGRSFGAHITFLQPIAYIYSIPIDVYGMSVADMMPEMRAVAGEFRQKLEERLKSEDVRWDWVTVEGPADARILSMVNTFDLLVLGACDPFAHDNHHSSLVADMAVHAHTPVLVVPSEQNGFDCSRPAIVAWDGSAEASRALRAAVPILQRAQSVHLVSVDEDEPGKPYDLPAISGAEYLSRHEIESELVEMHRNELDIAECITNAARGREAGLIVMGAYGRSRLRQNLLGGVTRDMITDPELPLFMHH